VGKDNGLPKGKEKLIDALRKSKGIFNHLQKVVSSSDELGKDFNQSIENIEESIKIINKMNVYQLKDLVDNMEINIYDSKKND
jgi:hypothetical protein